MKEGWEIKNLGEILEVLRNGVNCQQDKNGNGDKISRIESISSAEFDISKVGYSLLSQTDKDKYQLLEGDILFSHINSPIHVGKTAIFNLNENVYQGVNLLLLRPYPFLDKSYLNHFLKFIFQNGYWLRVCKQSVNQASVNQQDIKKVEIKYPKSLPEQQRIVQLLDEAFEKIDTLKANAERNLQNAKELFQSALTEELKPKEGWEEKKLKDIGIAQTGTTPKTVDKENFGDFVPFIKPADIDIKGNGEIRYDNDGLSEKGLKNGRKMLKGSILMVCIGATIGKVGIVDRDVSCNQQINSLTVKEQFSPKFIYYAMSTKSFFQLVLNNAAQATLPIINKGKWEILTISFPKSLTEQQTIVEHLDAMSARCKALEINYQKTIAQCDEMKKAVLAKAFKGEL